MVRSRQAVRTDVDIQQDDNRTLHTWPLTSNFPFPDCHCHINGISTRSTQTSAPTNVPVMPDGESRNKEIVGTPLHLRVRPNGVRKPTPKFIHIGPGTLAMMTVRFAGLLQRLFSVSNAHTTRIGSSDVSNDVPFPSLSIKNHVRPSTFTKASIKIF